MIEQTILVKDARQRADKYIIRLLPGASKSLIYKQIRKKNITLNGKKMDGSEALSVGDKIQFFFSEETFNKFKNVTNDDSTSSLSAEITDAYNKISGVNIVYEDDNLIFMNKPQNVLSQKSDNNEPSLNEWLLGYLINTSDTQVEDYNHFKPSVLNRLDKNTSGLVIGSKTLLGASVISEALRTRDLHKYYLAYVKGKCTKEGILNAYHKKNSSNNRVTIKEFLSEADNEDDYVKITTGIKCLKEIIHPKLGVISLIEVELITGKSHQIRAHLAHIGNPILGDEKYGDHNLNMILKTYGIYNQMLHSYKVIMPANISDELAELKSKVIVCKPPNKWSSIDGNLEITWT